MKKLTALLLIVLLAIPAAALSACGKDGLKNKAQITIDGEVNESAYNDLGSLKTGIKGMAEVKFAASKEGLYAGITVTDADMRYTDDLLTGDYIGISIDTAAKRWNDDAVSESSVLFRFDVMGRYIFSRGDDYGNWQDVSSGEAFLLSGANLPDYKLILDGTAQDAASTGDIIGNVGYSAELFFTWELLGTTASNVQKDDQSVLFNIEHRNYGEDICSTANVNAPSLYNTLRVIGKRRGINKPTAAPEITVDGKMNESVWQNATVTNYGNFADLFEGETAGDFTAKAFMGKNGLYIGVFVDEPELWASEPTGSAYRNCGLELRIHVFDEDDVQVLAYKWLFDLFGPQWHETSSGLDSSFAPYAEYAYDIAGTVNNNSDTDTSWGFELYIPYEHLNITAPQKQYVKLLNAVGSAPQHNALHPDYTAKNSDNWNVVADYVKLIKA